MYEDKFIAFVDILGFSELVERSEKGGDGALTVQQVLGLTRMLGSPKERRLLAEHGPTTCPCAPYKAKDLNFRVTQISDCVVASAEISPAGLINLVQHCFEVSIRLLRAGHLCRGHVRRGKIFHIDNEFFGTGYQRAYESEKTVSIFQANDGEGGTPFIEIDPEVCRYVAEQPDACVKTMFGRMTESDGHSTAISPFPALKNMTANFDNNFDPARWKAEVQVAREAALRLLSQLEKAEAGVSARGRAKIEHYKSKIREVLVTRDKEDEMIRFLSQPFPRNPFGS